MKRCPQYHPFFYFWNPVYKVPQWKLLSSNLRRIYQKGSWFRKVVLNPTMNKLIFPKQSGSKDSPNFSLDQNIFCRCKWEGLLPTYFLFPICFRCKKLPLLQYTTKNILNACTLENSQVSLPNKTPPPSSSLPIHTKAILCTSPTFMGHQSIYAMASKPNTFQTK
jgi:hypothetical protein